AEFGVDQRMIAVDGAEPLGRPVRPIGEIKPFSASASRWPLSVVLTARLASSDGLCRVLSIVVFFAHGRCGWRRRLSDFGPQWQTANPYSQTGSAAARKILCDFNGFALFRAVLGEGKFVTIRTYCERGTNRVQSFHCQLSQASGGGRTFRALRFPVI